MKILEREEGFKKFSEFWDAMQSEWFKVEVLQDYTGEDDNPSLREWLAGNHQKAIELLRNKNVPEALNDEISGKSNVKKIRIHVVETPFSPYLEWEIEHYKNINIPIWGESIYLLPKEKVANLAIPDGDFAIFDNKRVIKFSYSSDGKVTGADVYEEGDDISHFLDLKENLFKLVERLNVELKSEIERKPLE